MDPVRNYLINMTIAVIETGGKQYKVKKGDRIKTELLRAKEGAKVIFDKVLFRAEGESFEVGMPYIKGANVEAKVLNEGRGDRKMVFRYHSKTRYRKKKTHRQHYTELEILKV
jgi:large subunit ribosomal protein L21